MKWKRIAQKTKWYITKMSKVVVNLFKPNLNPFQFWSLKKAISNTLLPQTILKWENIWPLIIPNIYPPHTHFLWVTQGPHPIFFMQQKFYSKSVYMWNFLNNEINNINKTLANTAKPICVFHSLLRCGPTHTWDGILKITEE